MKFIITLLVLFFIWSIIYIPIFGLKWETGNGNHVGYVTAVEKNGLFFKTGRAYIKSDVSSSQEDNYCVIDDEVYSKLLALAEKKVKIKITYHSLLSAGLINCATEDAIISKVEEIK